ncbi:MAG: hypothetical protein Ct9H300mP1_06960 [Planctomycetaceae bacterium]|nr:MAG: hypothetical protein Ct9H300mP1_06960 [Planctomycetaceae bacterium]
MSSGGRLQPARKLSYDGFVFSTSVSLWAIVSRVDTGGRDRDHTPPRVTHGPATDSKEFIVDAYHLDIPLGRPETFSGRCDCFAGGPSSGVGAETDRVLV